MVHATTDLKRASFGASPMPIDGAILLIGQVKCYVSACSRIHRQRLLFLLRSNWKFYLSRFGYLWLSAIIHKPCDVHYDRNRRGKRPGTHKGPSTPNLTPCHYISYSPLPRRYALCAVCDLRQFMVLPQVR